MGKAGAGGFTRIPEHFCHGTPEVDSPSRMVAARPIPSHTNFHSVFMASGFMTRILAVDPGDTRIGLAISDPSGTIARPLVVIEHVSRQSDAQRIVQYAVEYDAEVILVGIALDASGQIGHQARKELRLVDALRTITEVEIETWDETDSTQTALQLAGKRDNMTDARAAAVILQEYLNAQ